MCERLEQLVNDGSYKDATKLRYEILDMKETMGGMEELDSFLAATGEKLTAYRKAEREARKSSVK